MKSALVHIKKIVVMFFLGSFCCMIANQFVIQKTQKAEVSETKQKELSRAQLQESCCQEIAHVLREIPSLLRHTADMHSVGLKLVTGFFEGNKMAALERSDKVRLKEIQEKVTQLTVDLKKMNQDLAGYVKDLHAF